MRPGQQLQLREATDEQVATDRIPNDETDFELKIGPVKVLKLRLRGQATWQIVILIGLTLVLATIGLGTYLAREYLTRVSLKEQVVKTLTMESMHERNEKP